MSKYVLYNKYQARAPQYSSIKLLYTFKKYFQTGFNYNTGYNTLNFNFYDRSLTRVSNSFGRNSFATVSEDYYQISIPIQTNLVTNFFAEPYIGIAGVLSYRRFDGNDSFSSYSDYEDTIRYKVHIKGVKTTSTGYQAYIGMKFHILERFLFKTEAGYSLTKKSFCNATLDYTYNGVPFYGVTFDFSKGFTYFSLGVSYKFKLYKEKTPNKNSS